MATDPDEIHTEVEHVSIEPKGDEADEGDENTDAGEGAEGTDPAEGEGAEGEAPAAAPEKKEQLVQRTTVPLADPAAGTVDPTQRLPGETPREYALRQEVTNLRGKLRTERSQELLGTPAGAAPAAPAKPVNNEILAKYKPEEIKALQEVAEALGFVKADQLQAQTYEEKGQAQLNAFLDKHSEYSPENDKDGKLWDAFKQEFAIYKQPADPKDFARIFNKVHSVVFGIQAAPAGGKQNAAKEKITVASRGSSPAPSNAAPSQQRQAAPGVRKDMLKGFSPEELAEMGIE